MAIYRDQYVGDPVHYLTSGTGQCHPAYIIENYEVVDGYPVSADIIQQDVLGLGGLPLRRNGVVWNEAADTADTWHPRSGCPRTEPIS